MRVLHILDHSAPLHSGYTFRTLSILREQRRRGWETFQLTGPKQGADTPPEEAVDGWHFYRTPLKPAGPPVLRELALMRRLTARLIEVARRVQPDLLHAHSPVLNAIPAVNAGRALGLPVVYEVRAFWEDAAVDHGTSREGGLRYRATRGAETYALRRADAVTTICEGLRGDILARGLPTAKVTVIPNAVDAESFAVRGQPDVELRRRLGLEGAVVLGFIGSFYAYEGLDLLLRAFPEILKREPRARLLLVGGGPQEAELKRLAQSLGVEARVGFVGRVPHAEVPRYYDLIDLLVYARHAMRLTELVTPLKPLEAMAQGRLLIASAVGGHREVVPEPSLLFRAGDPSALADKALALLGAPQDWEGFRERGRAFVERERTWAASVARYAPVYERLTQRAT